MSECLGKVRAGMGSREAEKVCVRTGVGGGVCGGGGICVRLLLGCWGEGGGGGEGGLACGKRFVYVVQATKGGKGREGKGRKREKI